MNIRLAGAMALCSVNVCVLSALFGCAGQGDGSYGGSTGSTTGSAYSSTTGTTTGTNYNPNVAVPSIPGSSGSLDAGVPTTSPTYTLQLSADDSTSMASAEIAKLVDAGVSGLHRHEFMNYYDPPASLMAAEPWALVEDAAPSVHLSAEAVDRPPVDTTPGEVTMLLSLQADAVLSETRRPWNLVYCIDVSGSMAGEKIDFVRQSLLASLARMRTGDRVSLVTFETTEHLIFQGLAWPADEATIRQAFSALMADGSTNMIAGLNLAYQLANAQRTSDRLTRVILFGDGDANVGDTDVQHFRDATRVGNEEGVYLTSVGVGYGFDWNRMDLLADAGKGASVFLPNAVEAMRLFGTEQFTKLVEITSDEVHVEMELPSGLTVTDFSGEEYTTNTTTRLPSIVLASGDDITMLTRLAYTDPSVLDMPATIRISMRPLGTGTLTTWEHTFTSVRALLGPGGPALARATIVDDYGRNRALETNAPDDAALAAAIDAFVPSDPGLAEIRGLLRP